MTESVMFTWVAIIVICAGVIAMRGKWKKRNPGKFQAFLEFVVISLDNFTRSIVGDEAKTLTPIIGSFFIFIFILSILVLIPGFMSPTGDTNTTFALAIVAFLIVQYLLDHAPGSHQLL